MKRKGDGEKWSKIVFVRWLVDHQTTTTTSFSEKILYHHIIFKDLFKSNSSLKQDVVRLSGHVLALKTLKDVRSDPLTTTKCHFSISISGRDFAAKIIVFEPFNTAINFCYLS